MKTIDEFGLVGALWVFWMALIYLVIAWIDFDLAWAATVTEPIAGESIRIGLAVMAFIALVFSLASFIAIHDVLEGGRD